MIGILRIAEVRAVRHRVAKHTHTQIEVPKALRPGIILT